MTRPSIALPGAPRRDRADRFQQIARQQAVPEGVAQRALGHLPRRGGLPRARGLPAGDEGPLPSSHVRRAFADQAAVRLLNGVRVDSKIRRQPAHGRERLVGLQNADGDRPLDLVHDLAVDGPGVGRVDVDEHLVPYYYIM